MRNKEYKKNNKEKIREQGIKYRAEHKNKISEYLKQYSLKNKKRISEYQKKYRENNKKQIAISKAKWACKNKIRIKLNHKLWRDNNKKHLHIWNKKYKQKNLNRFKANSRRRARKRRAIKLEINENFTIAQEKIIYMAFNNKCFNCGSTEYMHIDHHRPLSKLNPLTVNNAVLLCRTCNLSKGDKDPEEFYGEERCKELDLFIASITQ